MVTLRPLEDGTTEVRFEVGHASHGPASVVGDFNDWTPGATPLTSSSDDSMLTALAVCDPGRYAYRILCAECGWADDDQAIAWQEGPHGAWDAVVVIGAEPLVIDLHDADGGADRDVRGRIDASEERTIDLADSERTAATV